MHRQTNREFALRATDAPFLEGRLDGYLGGIEDIGLGLRWDAAALAREIDRRAAALDAMGIGRGCVVAIAHGASAHFFADLLATWQLGATAVCLDQSLTRPELETILGFARPVLLLVDGTAPSGTAPVRVAELANVPPTRSWSQPVNIVPEDPALILFTSGTTGVPKGVVLSFRAIRNRLSANVGAIGAAALRRTLVTLPTHFGHGLIGNSLTPLLCGGDIVLYPLGVPLMQSLGRIIDEHQISFLSSVPALWRLATRYDAPSGGSLVRVHVGSAPFAAQLWSAVVEWTRADVVNCYGLTETANWVAGASSRQGDVAEGLVGEAWGTTVAIMRDDGTIQETGEGEIVVRSPAMMSGYLNRRDLTATVLRDGWFHTGDRGFLDERCRLRLAGRIKDEINRSGVKIQPAEIDLLLERHPAVAEACVFAVPDAVSGEAVAAAVRPADGANIGPQALASWCCERLRHEAVPEHWFVVDALPRNARGKISRDAVRQMLAPAFEARRNDGGLPPAVAAARQPGNDRVRSAVERAWFEAFDRSSLAAKRAWDQCGDSMDALRFWFAIEEQLGIRLSFDLLAPGATADMLVAAIRRHHTCAESDSATIDAAPLVIFVPSLEGDMPLYARLRATFAGCARFEVIHYPTAAQMLDGSFDTIVDAAVAQVCARGNGTPYRLLGISSGGFVAWEVARRLLDAGERVGFMGLVDARRSDAPPDPRPGLVARIRDAKIRPRDAFFGFAQGLIERSATTRLRVLLAAVGLLLPSSKSASFRMQLGIRLRRHELEKAVIEPLALSATLFRTGEERPGAYDYGWGALCERLTIVGIEGAHLDMFEPQHLDSLRDRIMAALKAATGEADSRERRSVRRAR